MTQILLTSEPTPHTTRQPVAKVQHSEEAGAWDVNYEYWGTPADADGRPLVMFGRDEDGRISWAAMTDIAAAWCTMSLTPNDGTTARALAARGHEVATLIAQNVTALAGAAQAYAAQERAIWGRSPANAGRFPRARVAVRRTTGGWKIVEYDYHAWSAFLPDQGSGRPGEQRP